MYFHLLLAIFATTLYSVLAKTNYCPPQESSVPCYCAHGLFYGGNGTRVQCMLINDTQTFIHQVQRLRGYSIDYFFLSFSNLTNVPSGVFNGTSVKRIIIQTSTIDRQGGFPFEGLEDSLEEISLLFVDDIAQWYWPEMKNLKKLKSVELNFSPIHFVDHHTFAEIGPDLESIFVTFCDVNRIHPQAFQELTNLRRVSFSGNEIRYLERTMFPNPAPNLEWIDFNNNKLSALNENIFENMPALKSLDFSVNAFKFFESKAFMPVWNQLEYFHIAINPFKCDCSLIILQQKMISGSLPLYVDLEQVTCKNPGDEKETYLKDLDAESMHCKL